MNFLKFCIPPCISIWIIGYCLNRFELVWWQIPLAITLISIGTGIGIKWVFKE